MGALIPSEMSSRCLPSPMNPISNNSQLHSLYCLQRFQWCKPLSQNMNKDGNLRIVKVYDPVKDKSRHYIQSRALGLRKCSPHTSVQH